MLDKFKCNNTIMIALDSKNVDGAMHFIYLHKYNTYSTEDSSDMN